MDLEDEDDESGLVEEDPADNVKYADDKPIVNGKKRFLPKINLDPLFMLRSFLNLQAKL